MRYSFITAAIMALTSGVFAQTKDFDSITSPTQDQQVAPGSSLDIVWEPSTTYTGTVTITLLEGGNASTLALGPVIKAGVDQTLGTYAWTVPTASFATYGFKISLDSDPTVFQYSFPFHITGFSGSTTTSTATGSATSTTTVQLGPGTAYTSTTSSTSSVITSTNSVNSTVTLITSTTSIKSTSNVTLSTTLVSKTSSPTTASGTTASSTTSSGLTSATKNAAVGKAATGGLAMVGFVLAFAL